MKNKNVTFQIGISMNLFKNSPMNSEKRWEIARLEMIEKQIIGRGI